MVTDPGPERGQTYAEIAETYGVSTTLVYKWTRTAGFPEPVGKRKVPGTGANPHVWDTDQVAAWVAEHRGQGWTRADIAETYGVSAPTVNRWAARSDWPTPVAYRGKAPVYRPGEVRAAVRAALGLPPEVGSPNDLLTREGAIEYLGISGWVWAKRLRTGSLPAPVVGVDGVERWRRVDVERSQVATRWRRWDVAY